MKTLRDIQRVVTIEPVVSSGFLKPVTALLGSTAPKVEAEGGWLVVNRPKKVGFTAWEGYPPRTMSLSIMLDGFAEDESQEEEYTHLYLLMRRTFGKAQQPMPVKLTGPVPLTHLKWVIQSIDEDSTTMIRDRSGDLLRLEVTLSLLEYVEADVLVSTPAATSPVGKTLAGATLSGGTSSATATPGKTYTVKVGDTLWGIAQKTLGAGKRYTEIASLNGIKNPNSVPVGTVLKIP